MDPSSISSPPAPVPNAVPFAVEPNNHPPPPPLHQSPPSIHPPYAEMIYTAIEALKEQNGSSKRAIAKYIEHVYKDQLPPSHTTLLTHHLKRLKSDGLLSMVKNSYIIPRSTPPLPSSSPPQPSRPRGRPRKPQSQSQPLPPPIIVTNNNNPAQQQQQAQNAEPVWAALGLADEPSAAAAVVSDGSNKRGRGRPKKGTGLSPSPIPIPVQAQGGAGAVIPPTPSRGRGRPPGSKAKSKRRPGRPPKVQPETTTAAAVVSGGAKKRPGRPAKNQKQNPTPIPFAAPVSEVVVPNTGVEGVAVLTPRSRGRPRKNNSAVAAVPVAVVAPAGRGRGRGRGRGGGGRGRGRGGVSVTVQARPAGKRPVGRPKKGTTPATATATATAPENAANEDLRRKLEHFQGRVKESLALLRPHFNHESPVTAIAAIQELEILVAMDLNEPLKDEPLPQQQNLPVQDQPPPQQPPPQQVQPQQVPPQHFPAQQIAHVPQVFPQYPPFHIQEFQFQQQQQLYQPPPPQQNQFHP